jgi:hypothetical protein
MAETRIGEALLKATLISQQQKTFAVCVQSSCGINLRHIDELSQTTPAASCLRGELTEDAVGLVEQQGGQPAFSRALHRLTTPIEISSRPRSMVIGGSSTAGQAEPAEPRSTRGRSGLEGALLKWQYFR